MDSHIYVCLHTSNTHTHRLTLTNKLRQFEISSLLPRPALSRFHRLLSNGASPGSVLISQVGGGSKKTTLKFPGGKDSREMSSGATGDASHLFEEGLREETARDGEGRNECGPSIC